MKETMIGVRVVLPETLSAENLRRIIEEGITHAPLYLGQEKVEVSILWKKP